VGEALGLRIIAALERCDHFWTLDRLSVMTISAALKR
jgi:hypothetical protein